MSPRILFYQAAGIIAGIAGAVALMRLIGFEGPVAGALFGAVGGAAGAAFGALVGRAVDRS